MLRDGGDVGAHALLDPGRTEPQPEAVEDAAHAVARRGLVAGGVEQGGLAGLGLDLGRSHGAFVPTVEGYG